MLALVLPAFCGAARIHYLPSRDANAFERARIQQQNYQEQQTELLERQVRIQEQQLQFQQQQASKQNRLCRY